jgi:hypothetical protein
MSWTGQLDAMLNRKFISCTSGNTVTSDLWWAGEPDNNGAKEFCVSIKFANKSAALQDIRCGEPINVICEVRMKYKYGNVVHANNLVRRCKIYVAENLYERNLRDTYEIYGNVVHYILTIRRQRCI